MAITNAQQYQQLVNKPADGKRPGYRGPGGYQGGRRSSSREAGASASRSRSTSSPRSSVSSEDRREQVSVARTSNQKTPTTSQIRRTVSDGPDDRSSELQKYNQAVATGRISTTKPGEAGGTTIPTLNKREQEFQDFLDRRNKVNLFGLSKFFTGPAQAFSDFNASINRPFFGNVIRAGKIPGLSFDATEEEFEEAYQKYMSDRLAGNIDAYGNPLRNNYYDSSGNLVVVRDDGPDQPIIPITPTDPTDPTTPPPSTGVFAGIAPRFVGSQFDFDALRANAMDGGMIEDTPVGGIMDLESGRQMYFLGKLVKKATRAVKKVAKSPLGKAALGAALFKFGGGFGGGAGSGTGILSRLKTGLIGTLSGGEENIFKGGKFSGLANFFRDQYTSDGGKLKFGLGLGLGVPFALDALGVGKEEDDGFDIDEYYKTQGIDIDAIRNNPNRFLARRFVGMADGGRIEYDEAGAVMNEKEMKKLAKSPLYKGFKKMYGVDPSMAKDNPAYEDKFNMFEQLFKKGFAEGGDVEPVAKKTMPLLDMDGKEKDYRETGGFVDMGRMERADDVPARLSKNEFVFTADAVRNAGDGDIDKGAEVMYNMMKNLEAGGDVSEESQGLEGARNMFQTSQRLGEVL